jgi:hypothetical protein
LVASGEVFLKIEVAAAVADCHPKTIKRALEAGELTRYSAGAKLRINLSGSDVLSGRASSEIATTSDPFAPRGDGETVTRTVTFAVTIPSASRGSVVQLHKTPQDFSQGVLRGGRDLNWN